MHTIKKTRIWNNDWVTKVPKTYDLLIGSMMSKVNRMIKIKYTFTEKNLSRIYFSSKVQNIIEFIGYNSNYDDYIESGFLNHNHLDIGWRWSFYSSKLGWIRKFFQRMKATLAIAIFKVLWGVCVQCFIMTAYHRQSLDLLLCY